MSPGQKGLILKMQELGSGFIVNIGSGIAWVPSGNKPLPEPMMT